MEGSFVYKGGKIHKVPADEKEALASGEFLFGRRRHNFVFSGIILSLIIEYYLLLFV